MVSQVEPLQSLALRGPSSVVSRQSRHRRHGRSHAGGSSYAPQNEFPIFSHSGDVEIVVKAGSVSNRYLLHRLILTNCSGFFEASTSDEWSRAVLENKGELARIGEDSGSESSRRKEVKRRWRYELDPGTGPDDIPMLVQKEDSSSLSLFGDARPPPVRNKPAASNTGFFRSVANLSLTSSSAPAVPPISQEDQDLLTDYDNLFRVFYNYAPALDAIDIANAYIQCKSLLTLADLYDALGVVGPRIDHHLLQYQGRLWKQIAKYPSSYLKLGYLAQSKTIFQEALIHVVGSWPSGERHIRNSLPLAVCELIEDKVQDLADLVAKIEGQLFRFTLTTSRGERVTPQNSYLDWLVISLFRQWLAEHTSPTPIPPSSRNGSHNSRHPRSNPTATTQHLPLPAPSRVTAPPAPLQFTAPALGRIYRLLGSSPPNYLQHEECKRFLKMSPDLYSRETLKKFERRMEEVKDRVRELVRPLMKCGLEGDGGGVGYLLCTRVEERDFVWDA